VSTSDVYWLKARPIAHRGFHDMNGAVWENTASAFRRAVERGFAIECDVHLSADGTPIVIHDGDLSRLCGADGFVWQRTAAELRTLRVGGTGDHPPTLRELLELVDGRVPLVIELKGIAGHDDGLVTAVASELGRYRGQAAIMSFDHWLVRDFRLHAPGIPGGLTALGTSERELEGHFSMLAHEISFVSYCLDHMPNRFVTFVREKLAMPVISWTVRDRQAVTRTFSVAEQITFEGFDPDAMEIA
jgi:glycerophosphoryl diester phosphodiesterase